MPLNTASIGMKRSYFLDMRLRYSIREVRWINTKATVQDASFLCTYGDGMKASVKLEFKIPQTTINVEPKKTFKPNIEQIFRSQWITKDKCETYSAALQHFAASQKPLFSVIPKVVESQIVCDC